MTARRSIVAAGTFLAAAAFAIGLRQSETPSPESAGPPAPSVSEARTQIEGAPPPLRALYAQSNALLPESTLDRLLAALRGYPVVINVWASYCGPCRREFSMFRRAAARSGTRVAFIGLNADATKSPARAFLQQNPTLYPHVRDPKGRLARRLNAGVVLPSTVILDRGGQIATVFAGAYPEPRRLEQDLARYADER